MKKYYEPKHVPNLEEFKEYLTKKHGKEPELSEEELKVQFDKKVKATEEHNEYLARCKS
jgi:hypothetical protein